jgi:beta-phosphoglucomutase
MLQAVIFDLDGVIVDSHPAHFRAWRGFLESLGKDVSEERLLFVLEGRRREDILRHFLGDLTPDQLRDYGKRKENLFREFSATVNLIGGVGHLLDDLRTCGVPMAVASSGSRHRVDLMLERLALKTYFKIVVAGDDVTEGKPAPAIFCLAAQGLRVDPGSIVACEDSAAGITAAKCAGMKCLGIATHERRPILVNAGADRVVPDFRSIGVDELQQLFKLTCAD